MVLFHTIRVEWRRLGIACMLASSKPLSSDGVCVLCLCGSLEIFGELLLRRNGACLGLISIVETLDSVKAVTLRIVESLVFPGFSAKKIS